MERLGIAFSTWNPRAVDSRTVLGEQTTKSLGLYTVSK